MNADPGIFLNLIGTYVLNPTYIPVPTYIQAAAQKHGDMAPPALLPLAHAVRPIQHVRVRLLPHPPPAHLPLHGHFARGRW